MKKISLEEYERIKGQVEALAYRHRDQPWHKWPMVRDLAKRFMVSQDTIIDMAGDSDNLDIVAGIRCNNGVGSLPKGEQRIEWYQD